MRKILIGIFIAVIALAAWWFCSRVIIWDHSAETGGGASVYWKGKHYIETADAPFKRGEILARVGWDDRMISSVSGDEEHLFVVSSARYFGTGHYLLVREDYTIPADGIVTVACWGVYGATKDEQLVSTLNEILKNEKTDEVYTVTEELYSKTDNWDLKKLNVGYDNCPVATEYKGYLGTFKGKWALVNYGENVDLNEYPLVSAEVECYYIPDEFIPVLESYIEKEESGEDE